MRRKGIPEIVLRNLDGTTKDSIEERDLVKKIEMEQLFLWRSMQENQTYTVWFNSHTVAVYLFIYFFKQTLWFLLMGDNCILLAITNCVQLETRHRRRADSRIRQQTEGNSNLHHFAPFSLCVHRSMSVFWNLLMAIKLQSPFYVMGVVTPNIWSAVCTEASSQHTVIKMHFSC